LPQATTSSRVARSEWNATSGALLNHPDKQESGIWVSEPVDYASAKNPIGTAPLSPCTVAAESLCVRQKELIVESRLHQSSAAYQRITNCQRFYELTKRRSKWFYSRFSRIDPLFFGIAVPGVRQLNPRLEAAH
jgi:hypothetical protein